MGPPVNKPGKPIVPAQGEVIIDWVEGGVVDGAARGRGTLRPLQDPSPTLKPITEIDITGEEANK